MKPRTLWACHSVAFMISARVDPFARPIRPRIFAPLLSGRGVVASFARAGLAAEFAAFLPAVVLLALACFLVVALALPPLVPLPPLAPCLALGAPFFWLTAFFRSEERRVGKECR